MGNLNELGGFDANKVDPTTPFEVLPAGDYEVVIVNSELKATSRGDGKLLELTLQVLSGEHQNRKLWDRLNLINPSAAAQQIARGTLSAICRAVGVATPNDSSELHGKPLVAVVKVKKQVRDGKETGSLQNEVAGYKPRATFAAPAPQQQTAAGATPW